MRTEDLIEHLAADARPRAMTLSSVWWAAFAAATVLAAAIFFVSLGPRPDIAAAAETPRFVFKFVFTAALVAGAFGLIRALSRPGESWRGRAPYLAVAPALLMVALAAELIVVPPEAWPARLVGANGMVCLTFIPVIGAGPLVIFVLALRHGAPTRPMLAGATAGLLAGGIAAAFYAAQCTDDSPLFVAAWYTVALAGLALAGAAAGRQFARW